MATGPASGPNAAKRVGLAAVLGVAVAFGAEAAASEPFFTASLRLVPSAANAIALGALRTEPGVRADLAPPFMLLPGVVDPSVGPFVDLNLVEVVARLSPKATSVPPSPPVDADARDRALRAYVEGRAALADGKTFLAVRTLEKALAADPSSIVIRGELARAYAKAGNQPKSMSLSEEVLDLDPDDPEALFTVGLRAADAGDAEAAIRRLGRLLLLEGAARTAFFAGLRPGSEAIVEIALSRALRQLNADRASIEILTRAARRENADLSPRVRAEARRALGDAHARLGDIEAALSVWLLTTPAGDGRAADPSGARFTDALDLAVIEPRVTWALVALGREGEAIGRLRARVGVAAPSDVDIAIAAWMRDVVHDATPFARWAQELNASPASTPNRVDIARLAAALDPERAEIARADFTDRRAMRDAFARLARDVGVDDAIRAALDAIASGATTADRAVSALLRSGADAPSLLAAAQRLGGSAAALHARLCTAVNDPGEGWRIASEALVARKDDREALRAAIDAAGRLAEPGFLVDLERNIAADDAWTTIELARAWRGGDDPARSAGLARSAAEIAAGIVPPDRKAESAALMVLAQAQADQASRSADRRAAELAVASARSAVVSDPTNESAWRLLIGLLDALSSGEGDDRAGRRAEANNARTEAAAAMPSSALARQGALERVFSEGSLLDGIHPAVAFAAADPGEPELLQLAVTALTRAGRIDAAIVLLDERLAETPGDPIAWQLWTEATIASGNPERALDRIMSRAEPPTSDPIARPLEELAMRAVGRVADADVLAAERVARLPASPRRDLERAAQALGRGDDHTAASALSSAAGGVNGLPAREALAAAELASRLKDARERARLVRLFALAVLDAAGEGTTNNRSPARVAKPAVEPAVVARAAALVALESDPRGDVEGELRRMIEVAVRAARNGVGAGEVPAWLGIGQAFVDRGRPTDGAAFLAALLRSDSRIDSSAAARLASACFALDAASGGGAEQSIAILDLMRARGVRPFARADRAEATDADALQLLSGVYTLTGDRSGSAAIMRESLRRDPDHGMSANNLAWDAIERACIDEDTVRLAEHALRLLPNDPAVLDTVGWLRYLQGHLLDDAVDSALAAGSRKGEGAVTLLTRAIENAKGDPGPDPLDHLGDALWRTGDREGAIRAWQTAGKIVLAKFPKDQMIKTLATYERREHGVVVADGESFWKRNYGAVLERANAKLAQIARGEEPTVAPLTGQR